MLKLKTHSDFHDLFLNYDIVKFIYILVFGGIIQLVL